MDEIIVINKLIFQIVMETSKLEKQESQAKRRQREGKLLISYI